MRSDLIFLEAVCFPYSCALVALLVDAGLDWTESWQWQLRFHMQCNRKPVHLMWLLQKWNVLPSYWYSFLQTVSDYRVSFSSLHVAEDKPIIRVGLSVMYSLQNLLQCAALGMNCIVTAVPRLALPSTLCGSVK